MYNFTKLLCIFLFISSIMLGCKDKEEEIIVPKNVIAYNGVDYDLSKGILIDYGQFGKDEGHTQVLFLYSSGITVHENEGKIDSTSGTGQLIYLEMFSPVANMLGDGEYTYDIYKTYKPSTFDYAYAVLNADYYAGEGDLYEMISGKVTVKKEKEKDNYTVSFDCIEGEGKHITGFYKGPLTYFNGK